MTSALVSAALTCARLVAAFAALLRRDRERWGLSVVQAASRFGVRPSEYRLLEVGERWPSFDTYDRICKLFGWPQTFVGDSLIIHEVRMGCSFGPHPGH